MMPGGEKIVLGDQIIYSTVTREYAGTYVCTGDNGEGDVARDTTTVQVKCESQNSKSTSIVYIISDSPIVSLHHGYLHQPGNVSLELICNVDAFPRASVVWLRTDHKEISMERSKVEEQGLGRHVLITENPTEVFY